GAGDAEPGRLAARPGGAAERLERSERVLYQHVRAIDRLGDDCSRRARTERALHETMAVVDRARHGDEQVTPLHFAAVESHAADFERLACRAAGRGSDLLGGPEDAHAAHSRATKASSNGSTVSPMICPVSRPLPATSTMSPSPAVRMASAMASRRPATSVAPDAPAITSARLRAGSSLRGLSSVTITTSERCEATAPISGLLP